MEMCLALEQSPLSAHGKPFTVGFRHSRTPRAGVRSQKGSVSSRDAHEVFSPYLHYQPR